MKLFHKSIRESLEKGGRATIKMANLVTGARMITWDFYEDSEPGEIGKIGKYKTLPTIGTGAAELEKKVADLLNKLNSLPLNQILNDADTMIVQLTQTLESANKAVEDLNTMLAKNETQHIPESAHSVLEELREVLNGMSPDSNMYQDLNESIQQLNSTMRNIEELTYTIDTKPNSIIFSKPKKLDMQPKAPIK